MATHGMIDLETLGVEPDSVIMTLGAIKFDPFTDAEPHSPIYLRGDIEDQTENFNRSVDDNTLAWWGRQAQEIQDEAFGDHDDRVAVPEMLKVLNKSWNFWQIRDSRTLFAMMPSDPRKAIQESLHNALADCFYQAKCVQQSYKHFGVTK